MTVSDVMILINSKSKFNECNEKDIENRTEKFFLFSKAASINLLVFFNQ